MKRSVFSAAVAVLVVLADQVVKALVSASATLHATRPIIPGLLEFCYLHNDGAAMGLFAGARWPITVLTAVLIAACLAYLFFGKRLSGVTSCALALIIGGGIGNLIDRIRLGYVVDFVRFPISWFSYSFNIADCAICVGAALFVIAFLLEWFRAKRPLQEKDHANS